MPIIQVVINWQARYIAYDQCSPEIFRVGQIEEVQASFVGVKLWSGHQVFVLTLGEIVLLDRGYVTVCSLLYTSFLTYSLFWWQELQVKWDNTIPNGQGSGLALMPHKRKLPYSDSEEVQNVQEKMNVTVLTGSPKSG